MTPGVEEGARLGKKGRELVYLRYTLGRASPSCRHHGEDDNMARRALAIAYGVGKALFDLAMLQRQAMKKTPGDGYWFKIGPGEQGTSILPAPITSVVIEQERRKTPNLDIPLEVSFDGLVQTGKIIRCLEKKVSSVWCRYDERAPDRVRDAAELRRCAINKSACHAYHPTGKQRHGGIGFLCSRRADKIECLDAFPATQQGRYGSQPKNLRAGIIACQWRKYVKRLLRFPLLNQKCADKLPFSPVLR